MTSAQNLDFRSFELLLAVNREQSFTEAADKLGVSQSVVSYGIDKLRQAFDDPLFVRVAGQTVPTERCEAIIAFAQTLFADLKQLQLSGRFDPATTTERIVIACNYYERVLLIPKITAALKRHAPLMQIEIIDASGTGHEKLLNRDATLLIGPFLRGDTGFYRRTLMTDSYVCMLDPSHPATAKPLTLDRYLALDHIGVTYGGHWKSAYVTELESRGHNIRPTIHIPSPAGIEELVSGSNLVATLPAALAQKLGKNLRLIPCPVPTELTVQLVWTAQSHHSEMMVCLRNLIAAAVTSK